MNFSPDEQHFCLKKKKKIVPNFRAFTVHKIQGFFKDMRGTFIQFSRIEPNKKNLIYIFNSTKILSQENAYELA